MNEKPKFLIKNVEELIPYENNPRNNDAAVPMVAESIKEFGFKVPIIIDKDNVIIAGHTRLKAAKMLGLKEVPCIMADDLTDEQAKAFRLADNKVAELSEWNFEKLGIELEGLDNIYIDTFDLSFDAEEFSEVDIDEADRNPYTTKIKIPQYEITGDVPFVGELVDTTKADQLIKEIKEAEINEQIKEFLINAAYRHNVFNYSKIAEYYANAPKDVQELMEKSALVIIDFNDAIANGYISLKEEIENMLKEDHPNAR